MNTALEEQGFGAGLLCSLVPFADAGGRRVGLVYLYSRARSTRSPRAGRSKQRDNLLEIQVRDALAGELPIEQDLQAGWRSGARPGSEAPHVGCSGA